MQKLTEEQKLNYFQSLLRDEAIEFWQTLKIHAETTLADYPLAFNKENAKKDLREVSKCTFDRIRYNATVESFTGSLTKFKKTAKKAYGEKASDIAETFLFAILPVSIQNELAMAGKHDTTVEAIKKIVQRQCQYAQLIPITSCLQPLNQAYNYQERQQANQPASTNNSGNPTTTKEVKRKFEGNCRYSNIVGHKWIECRSRLRDEANGTYTKPNNVHNKQTTTANSINPTNHSTTPSWYARSVGKSST